MNAELYAVYYYLKWECPEGNDRKAALILSDKILDICREMDKQHLLDVNRAELVHAILSLECNWDSVVYYWIPSHKGITWNAYAGATAKRGVEANKDRRSAANNNQFARQRWLPLAHHDLGGGNGRRKKQD